MRLRTNHLDVHTDPLGFITGVAGAVAVFMFLAGVAWTVDGISYRRALPGLQSEAQALSRKEITRPTRAAPGIDPRQLADTVARTQRLNALPGAGGGEVLSGLTRFERLLPARARLGRLQYQAKPRRWALIVEAGDAELLATFARRLEADGGFGSVLVQSQTRDERKQGSVTRMELWVSE